MTPETLAQIHAACFDEAPRPWSATEFTSYLNDPLCVLLTKGQGFAVARVAGDEMELLTLAVAPDARRQGIGSDLIGFLEQTARERRCTRIFLEVSQDNIPAMALYKNKGFEPVGYRKDYYRTASGAHVCAHVLCKTLSLPNPQARQVPKPLKRD